MKRTPVRGYLPILVGFMAYQPLLGYFVPKSMLQLESPVLCGIKSIFHNHFKQVNSSYLVAVSMFQEEIY